MGDGVGVLKIPANSPGFWLVSALCGAALLEAFSALMPTMTSAMETNVMAAMKNSRGWMRIRRFFFFFFLGG